MSIFDNPIFHDAEKAREWLETLLWPEGTICPHCGLVGASYKLQGSAHRPGLYKCKDCEGQFTVTVNTVFERAHLPLNLWATIIYLRAGARRPPSALALSQMLGTTYKTAWRAVGIVKAALSAAPQERPLKFSALSARRKIADLEQENAMLVSLLAKSALAQTEPAATARNEIVQKPAAVAKERRCLTCQRSFLSEGSHNRLCDLCAGRVGEGVAGAA